MQLKGQQIAEFREALLNAFTLQTFQRMLMERLDKDVAHYASIYADFQTIVFDVIMAANREGWIDELILNSRESVPKNPKLYAFAQQLGLTSSTTEQFQQLERVVRESNNFLDSNQWLTTLSKIETQVCRIEVETDQGKVFYGTGFLISPNSLITNYHVMEAVILGEQGKTTEDGYSAKAINVKCRFDYKRLGNKVLNKGTIYRLDNNWKVDFSPNSPLDQTPPEECLDYAIIRLEGNPGNEFVASKTASSGETRGWITLPDTLPSNAFAPNSPLFILQHPQGEPLKIALDTNAIIGLNDNNTRLRYKTNTEPGSSGSPCFTQQLQLIALHHSGDPNFDDDHKPTYNEGIPFSAITALLRKRNISFDSSIIKGENSAPVTPPSSQPKIETLTNNLIEKKPKKPKAGNEYIKGQSITSSVGFISVTGIKKLALGVQIHEIVSLLHKTIKSVLNSNEKYKKINILSSLTGAIILIPDNFNIQPLNIFSKLAEEISKANILIRIGAAHGELYTLEDTDGALNFIGTPINIAARLCMSEFNNGILVHESLREHLLDALNAEHWLVNQASIKVKGKRNEEFDCYASPKDLWPLCQASYHYTPNYSIENSSLVNASVISYDLPGFSDGDLRKLTQRFNSVVFAFQQTLASEGTTHQNWNFYFSPGGDGGVFIFPQISKENAYNFAEKFAKNLEIESKNRDESISVNCRIGLHYGSIALYQNAEEIMRPTGTHIFIADEITSDSEAKEAGKIIFTEPLKSAVSGGDDQYFTDNFRQLSDLTISNRKIKRYTNRTLSQSQSNEKTDYQNLLKKLQNSLHIGKQAFNSQLTRRDALHGKIRNRLKLDDMLEYEIFFFRYFKQLDAEEKFEFAQIRAITEGILYKHNKTALEVLNQNPDLLVKYSLLKDLQVHFEFWLNKYEKIFVKTEEMCILYTGVEDGVPFPENLDQQIVEWLAQENVQEKSYSNNNNTLKPSATNLLNINVEEARLLYILHLSDIHLGTLSQANIYYNQLQLDLIQNLKLDKLDYLIISGDIANTSSADEYKAACNLINQIKEHFHLNNKQVIIVPGNHDLNWDLSEEAYQTHIPKRKLPSTLTEAYIPIETGALLRNEDDYKKRFDYFSDFYKEITGNPYPTNYEEQAILHTFTDDKLLVLSLNSAWQIDHHYKDRATINLSALGNALSNINNINSYKDYLKIAVWHHPITGQETMKSTDFLEQLAVAGFEVCLHGHIHQAIEGFHKYDDRRGLAVIGGGTFGAPAKEQTTSIPLQYNLLVLEPSKASITVRTRKKEKADGAWSADARWGDKEEPKAFYTIELKRSFQENKQKLDF